MIRVIPFLFLLACGQSHDARSFGDCDDLRDEAVAFGALDDFQREYYEDFDRAPKIQNDIWCR